MHDLNAGAVDQLVMIGVNPGYDAASRSRICEAFGESRPSGCIWDATPTRPADLATWHMPQTHELEAWSDLRSGDGTASLVQPLIRPLFRSWTDHELLALLTGRGDAFPYDLVRETWRPQGGSDFEGWWTRALHDGVIVGSALSGRRVSNPKLPDHCRRQLRQARV